MTEELKYSVGDTMYAKVEITKVEGDFVPYRVKYKGGSDEWLSERFLDENFEKQEKVRIPQFVADYIEGRKGSSLYFAYEDAMLDEVIKKWMLLKHNQELFARAWLDGYVVEEEVRYSVKVKNIPGFHLIYGLASEQWYFLDNMTDKVIAYHTRKELEDAGFGEVFDNPMFEVTEV